MESECHQSIVPNRSQLMSSANHSVIYAEVVTLLSSSWSHPIVLEQIKSACMVLRKDVGPCHDVAWSLHTLLME